MSLLEEARLVARDLEIAGDDADAELIFKALGNSQRLRVLRHLGTQTKTVGLLTRELNIPLSTLNQHLKVLEEAGLIQTDLRPATRGTEKICSGVYQKVIFDLFPQREPRERAVEISMPIGAYVDCEVGRPCGLASHKKIIGMQGDPEAFLEPERLEAQILWFAAGYVEYRFPKRLPPRTVLESIYVSMEVCSEAPGYNEDWPSDISLWINGVVVGSWTSPGDFGESRGLLNPDWWSSSSSQYGSVKTWQVNTQGSFIDGVPSSNVTIDELDIANLPFISVRIGVDPEAEFQGGVNLFGHAFGNFPQDLVMRLVYRKQ
jgi:predicted transcriptional regulator